MCKRYFLAVTSLFVLSMISTGCFISQSFADTRG